MLLKSSVRFLAVAVDLRLIDVGAANHAMSMQRSYRRAGVEMKVGAIATHLRYLTEPQCNLVAARLKEDKQKGQRLRDPIGRSFLAAQSKLGIRGTALIGLILLLVTTLAWVMSKDWQVAAGAGGLSATFAYAFQLISPTFVDGKIAWYRLVRMTVLLGVTFTFVYGFWLAYALSPAVPSDIRWKYLGVLSTIAVAGVISTAVAIWRHRETWAHEARLSSSQHLVCRVQESLFRGSPLSDQERNELAVRILAVTVSQFSLNVFARLVARFVFWNKAAGFIYLSYLEPEPGTNYFRSVFYAATPMPERVKAAVDKVRTSHQPVRFEAQVFSDLMAECRAAHPERWKEMLLDQVARKDCISLTGYVFDSQRSLRSGDLDSCLAFNRDYTSVLDSSDLTGGVSSWLDCLSVVAHPVVRADGASRGVLLAFRTIKNGFSPEDVETLRTNSALLTAVLA